MASAEQACYLYCMSESEFGEAVPKKRLRGKPFTKDNHPPGRWKKGESGNPTGLRKDGVHPQKLLKLGEAKLSALIETELAKDNGALARALATELVKRAIEGDPFATKAVLDRVEGAVERKVNISATMTQQMVSLLDAPKPEAFSVPSEVVDAEVVSIVDSRQVAADTHQVMLEVQREMLDVEDLEC